MIFHFKPYHCAWCNHVLNTSEYLGEAGSGPEDEPVTICHYCQNVNIITGDTLRKPNKKELFEILKDLLEMRKDQPGFIDALLKKIEQDEKKFWN